MQGELMISGRVNFQKVYDLTERVLPEGLDTSMPGPEEHARFLITRYLKANGLGRSSEISYLQKNIKSLISDALREMLSSGELIEVDVSGNTYAALPDSLDLLDKPLARSRLKILSPFDNLLIQRKRIKTLFDFDYQIECYLPEEKRQYGYFSLPILWDGKLLARMDCKAEREKSRLHIHHLALEPRLLKTDAFAHSLSRELVPFMRFNNCNHLSLHRTTPLNFKGDLQDALAIVCIK